MTALLLAGLRCYTTLEAVSPEINITQRITYISERNTCEEWAEKIYQTGWDKKDCLDILMNSDYTFSNMKKKIMMIFNLPFFE